MSRRRPLYIFLSILALVLSGTVVVLSSFAFYLKINPAAYLTQEEVPILDSSVRWNASDYSQLERIPRIIHQTWKSETLPDRWKGISQACRDMMPDYEYMLWTDAGSRDFIAQHYPWFLDTFDNYRYNIQRADAIRYFVLYHYGGIYMDLDIGCNRPLDPLLIHRVILPKTIPVGLSNDLMFAERHHPLFERAIQKLIAFDHNWVLNYPTVMFSTGPMFLSMVYGLYVSKHPTTAHWEIRVLPKALYGKNVEPGEAPHSFFAHYYGSSWHADDAALISFLGSWGKSLMWLGLIVLIIGIFKAPSRQRGFRRIHGYEILLPRWSHRTGRWHFSEPPSPPSGSSRSSSDDENSPIDEIPLIHVPFRPSSSPSSDLPTRPDYNNGGHHFFPDVRNRLSSIPDSRVETPRAPVRERRRRHRQGILFFFPAIFTAPQDVEFEAASSDFLPPTPPLLRVPTRSILSRSRASPPYRSYSKD